MQPTSDVPEIRIRLTNTAGLRPDGEFVLYWMIANRRARWNFSLQRAVDWARALRKPLWYDDPDGQYGRPAAFYQQLQGLNLGQAWQDVSAPVLVIRGSADTVMSRADSKAIAQIVNQKRPQQARYIEVEGMTHGLTVNGNFHNPLVGLVLNWIKERM